MIKTVHAEVRIDGLEMAHKYDDAAHLENYLTSTVSRQIAHFLLKEKMIYMTSEHSPYEDQNIYKATLYVCTENDYKFQQQGIYTTEHAERSGYERGVRVALARVAAKADGMKDDRLKRNQHAAAVLIETATEVEEGLI